MEIRGVKRVFDDTAALNEFGDGRILVVMALPVASSARDLIPEGVRDSPSARRFCQCDLEQSMIMSCSIGRD